MKSLVRTIEEKIKNNIPHNKMQVIDNTDKHKGHKLFKKNKLHLKIIIQSPELKALNKIAAHKKIMNLLSDEMKETIHALEIQIK